MDLQQNSVWSGQSTKDLQNSTRALLATFKKSVYPVCRILKINNKWKSQKKARGDFYVGPKRRIRLKLTLSRLFTCSSEIPNLFQRWQFEILDRKFQNFKNIACSMLRFFTKWCNKNVAPFSGHDNFFLMWC